MYEYGNGEAFGEYGEEAVSEEVRGNAIRSVGRLAGSLARALMTRRAAQQSQDGPVQSESPCPDAVPGDSGETPCARRARELRERAEAWRAARAARYGR